MEEQKPLKDIIAEKLDSKGFNLEKIFQATGVPKHYLEAILKGDWHKLPAAPYTRGYFKKLEGFLETGANDLWNLYTKEAEVKVSGPNDKLPENRFAIKNFRRNWALPAVILAGLIIYLAFNASRLVGMPKLAVTNPLNATVVTGFPSFTLAGEADPKDKILINDEEVFVETGGKFAANYNLQSGLNTFVIVAKKFLGRENKIIKQIIYQADIKQ